MRVSNEELLTALNWNARGERDYGVGRSDAVPSLRCEVRIASAGFEGTPNPATALRTMPSKAVRRHTKPPLTCRFSSGVFGGVPADRTSKLVMRVRFPSPALVSPDQRSARARNDRRGHNRGHERVARHARRAPSHVRRYIVPLGRMRMASNAVVMC